MALPISEKQRVGTDLSLEYGTAEEPGYHTLASLMGRDGEYAIFRKFSSLNMLNLLSMQAELLHLEEDYKRIVFRHEKGLDGVELVASFRSLHQAEDSEQKRVLDKIRIKLDEYNTALVKCNQVKALSEPRKSDLKFIRRWLRGSEDGEGKGFIKKSGDVELLTWSEDHDKDFTSVDGNAERDIWSSRIVKIMLAIWHSTCGRRRKADKRLGVVQYTGLESVTKLIVTVLAAMVPAVSVVALYFEKDLLKRIWIMMGLTIAFSGALTIFTGAKRIEIFSATAAFAAVEVIFIGSTDVGNKIATGG